MMLGVRVPLFLLSALLVVACGGDDAAGIGDRTVDSVAVTATGSSASTGARAEAGDADGAGVVTASPETTPVAANESPAEPGADGATTDEPDDAAEAEAATAGADQPAGTGASAIDWWAAWRAADAVDGSGGLPGDGARVALVPNIANGPSSVGTAADLSHDDNPPIFRRSAVGRPSIEFTFAGDTLLQTNGGAPWTGGAVLPAGADGITLAWVGVITDVASHNVKYLVTGLDEEWADPALLVEGEGLDRFAGWGGDGIEIRSADGTISNGRVHGVVLHLAGAAGTSTIEVDGSGPVDQPQAGMAGDVAGLTLGNMFRRNFSTTDHQFLFLGVRRGALSPAERAAFWSGLAEL